MENAMGAMSDAILFRKLYARIFSQQVRDETRLAQLVMMQRNSARNVDQAFEEFLAVLRNKVELDRRIVYKLGEQVAGLEKKETGKKGKQLTCRTL